PASGSFSASWWLRPPNSYRPSCTRFGKGIRSWPRPPGLISCDPYPATTSRSPAEYARSPAPTEVTTARWSPHVSSICLPDGARGRASRATGGVPVSAHPREQVVADPQRVGHCRERRVHGPDAGEDARVDDVDVVELVGAAVPVHGRRGRIDPAAAGARLVRHAGHRDLVLHVREPVQE